MKKEEKDYLLIQNENEARDWMDFLKNHTLPSRDVFDYRVHKKEYSEYFAQYGFQVSMVYADFYSRMWCSDYNDRLYVG